VRTLLVAAANKYTGAAAVAEHCARSLQAAGHEARLIFRPGRNLEARLRREPWAAPRLLKERSLAQLRANLEILRLEAAEADAVICHLPHDHLLCVLAGLHRTTCLVRSYRCGSHLRGGPYQRRLHRRVHAALPAHSEMAPRAQRLLCGAPLLALPVPLEDRFRPGADPGPWRQRLGIPADARVIGMVGKVAPGRGFDLLLQTAARLETPAHVLIVGHGEARPGLERLADRLGLGDRLHWSGYQELDLPQLYAAMDVVLMTAAGSDHGHRTISEAQACARPVVAAALPGVADLVDDGLTGRIAAPEPAALAEAASALLAQPVAARVMAERAAAAVAERRFEPSGHRLADFLTETAGCR